MVLIQNKIDLIDKAVITTDEAQALAEKVPVSSRLLNRIDSLPLQVQLKFYRTSVKEDYNINEGDISPRRATCYVVLYTM